VGPKAKSKDKDLGLTTSPGPSSLVQEH